MTLSTFIHRVVLKNYKSIAACDVRLSPLAILVGPNGSGKSNFLDALRFVSDALTGGLDQAVRARGYADDIISRSARHGDDQFGIELHFMLPAGASGHYTFDLRTRSLGGYEVVRETCAVTRAGSLEAHYAVTEGEAIESWGGLGLAGDPAPPRAHDRLYLVNASGAPVFRPVYDALSRMHFYHFNPDRMREPRKPDAGDTLLPDGTNIASVLRRMHELDLGTKRRIEQYLSNITPGITTLAPHRVGRSETLEFRQRAAGDTWRFQADQVSAGTLHALGVLVALFQARMGEEPTISLVGVEEPENALHPAAMDVLVDALLDASETVQVLVTTHSADLLDRKDIDERSILAVASEDGVTRIGPVDEVGSSVLRDRLYTAGELLRMDKIRPGADADGKRGGAQTAATPTGR